MSFNDYFQDEMDYLVELGGAARGAYRDVEDAAVGMELVAGAALMLVGAAAIVAGEALPLIRLQPANAKLLVNSVPRTANVTVDGRYRVQVRAQADMGTFTPVDWPETKLEDWLAEALPNIDFHMSLGIVQDTAVGTYDRWQYLAMLEGTNKPINITAVDIEGVRDQLEMAYIRVGGKEEWRKGPICSLYIEPVSPLSHSKQVVQKLLFCCDNDIPFVYTPCPLAGATAPTTLAGLLVQALAESLFGIVLSQLRKPGSQLIIGGLMSNMDMLSTIYCYGSPEMALLSAGYTDITKWLRVPEYETAGCSDAKLFDEQAAMEAAINIATAGLIGGNMIHDVGYLDSGLTSCIELMVASDEIIDMVKRILRGIPVTPETIALDVMREVGPGGHFMEHDHTYKRFKEEIWRPKLIDRQNWENWNLAGGKRYGERVHDRVIEILETETDPLLDDAMFKEMRRICELADARHKDEELDVKMFV